LQRHIASRPSNPDDKPLEVVFKVCMIEKICNDTVAYIHGCLNALREVVEEGAQKERHTPDATLRFICNHAKAANIASSSVMTADPLYIATHKMLREFAHLLSTVNVEKGSEPGLYLAFEWIQCCFRMLNGEAGVPQPAIAIMEWRNSVHEFKRLQNGGKPNPGGWRSRRQ